MSEHETIDENSAVLTKELQTLKRAVAPLSTPERVEAELLRALKAQNVLKRTPSNIHSARNWYARIVQWLAPGAALAASVAMALWMVRLPVPLTSGEPTSSPISAAESFVALQSLDRIALEPSPRLIETVIPRLLLADYGIAMSPETAGDTVRAQMLISAAGQPLAVRFSY